jgi:hypothetical protein
MIKILITQKAYVAQVSTHMHTCACSHTTLITQKPCVAQASSHVHIHAHVHKNIDHTKALHCSSLTQPLFP